MPSNRRDLRIVDQTRTLSARGYDLAVEDARLTLQVGSAASDGKWRIDARGKLWSGGQTLTVMASAPTRVAALRAVAEAWREEARELGPGTFNWTEVEQLLTTVRAL